jgi:hypothetical protein
VSGGPRSTNYVHDLLVADGKYLLNWTYAERSILLEDILFGVPGPVLAGEDFYAELNPTTWLATWIAGNFEANYRALSAPTDDSFPISTDVVSWAQS